jgi:hypothetical protein
MDAPVSHSKTRQLWLFAHSGMLAERIGPAVFAAIPECPGVYRFFGDDNRLLYIGQSCNLRARIGSYRYLTAESHPRRLRRMAALAIRVEWHICESAAAAIALEARLLLEHRPPFNRAGVWQPPPWWMTIEEKDGSLIARLVRDPVEENPGLAGPLPSSFRYTFASLMRAVHRWHWPETAWWDLPCGMGGVTIPPEQCLPMSSREGISAAALLEFAATGYPPFLDLLLGMPENEIAAAPDAVCWQTDAEELRKFSTRRSISQRGCETPAGTASAPAG